MARSSYSRDVKVDIPERKRIRKQNGQLGSWTRCWCAVRKFWPNIP